MFNFILLLTDRLSLSLAGTESSRGGRRARSTREAVFNIYRYDTGIWGFIDSFRVVLVNGMRKWYASY